MITPPSSFGELITQRREEQGLSQKLAAEQCDMSESAIAMIETGKRNPSAKVLIKLIQGLKIAPEDMLPFAPEPLRGLLENEVSRQALGRSADLERLDERSRQALGEAFLEQMPKAFLVRALHPRDVDEHGALAESFLKRRQHEYLYGFDAPWEECYWLALDARDDESPEPGGRMALIAPGAELGGGGLAVIMRPQELALRRLWRAGEHAIIEGATSREAVRWATLESLIRSQQAAVLPVAEMWVRHLAAPRKGLFRKD